MGERDQRPRAERASRARVLGSRKSLLALAAAYDPSHLRAPFTSYRRLVEGASAYSSACALASSRGDGKELANAAVRFAASNLSETAGQPNNLMVSPEP
jgi:hypothetical protein